MKNKIESKWCLIIYKSGETVEASVHWLDSERECLEGGEAQSEAFAIIEAKNIEFYDEEEEK